MARTSSRRRCCPCLASGTNCPLLLESKSPRLKSAARPARTARRSKKMKRTLLRLRRLRKNRRSRRPNRSEFTVPPSTRTCSSSTGKRLWSKAAASRRRNRRKSEKVKQTVKNRPGPGRRRAWTARRSAAEIGRDANGIGTTWTLTTVRSCRPRTRTSSGFRRRVRAGTG
uniref:(northern house mosquito) hypothetical protein n=1 Tax=Culex pipiens TaxID=7175 RepID=A0A8D8DGQ6_CULPI